MNRLKNYLIIIIVLFVFYMPNVNANEIGKITEFNYTGNYQEFVVPQSGYYKFELWGAQGGMGSATSRKLGYGGYTSGNIYLTKGTILYVYVGQKSNFIDRGTIFNAGSSSSGWPGGGATDIRLVGGTWTNFDSLKSRIMIAAGGGTGNTGTPGSAGGLVGYAGGGTKGGTQTSVAAAQSSAWIASSFGQANGGCGGGNGYYPGGGAVCVNGAGGGSSFISGHAGCDAISEASISSKIVHTGQSKHYSNYVFTDTKMIDGNGYEWTTVVGAQTLMPTHDGKKTMVGNEGDGYAKVTYLGSSIIKNLDIENAKIVSTGNDDKVNYYDVAINGDELDTKISLTTMLDTYTVLGIGEVTLKANEIHYITIIDKDGNLSIYALNVIKEHTKYEVSFAEVEFEFDEHVYNYDLEVGNDIKRVTPNINVGLNATYTISGINNFRVGKNKVILNVNEDGINYIYSFNIKREAKVKQVFEYPYTGNYQTFIAPVSGNYQIELWGGTGNKTAYGAYTKGNITLTKGEILYVYVGRRAGAVVGTESPDGDKTFFNTGTGSSGGWPGGGATDIRLVNGAWNNFNSIKSRIMVAGGGGTTNSGTAGAAGGLTGYAGGGTTGGTQIAPGSTRAGTSYTASYFGQANGGCTGGNGYYPGWGATCANGAGGGSSFISGHNGSNAIAESSTSSKIVHTGQSIHYSNKSFTDTVMIDGKGYLWTTTASRLEAMPNYAGGYFASGAGNNGDGYARITLLAPDDASANALLESLILKNEEGNNLINDFNAETFEYTIQLGEDDVILNLEALAQDLDALVVYDEIINMPVGNKNLEITVTAPSGDIKVYTIHLNRSESTNPYLDGIEINGFPLENFESTKFNYEIVVPYYVNAAYVEGILGNTHQKVTGDGVQILANNEATAELLVVSEDGENNKLYTIHIIKEKSTKLKSVTFKELNKTIELELDKFDYDLELNVKTHSLEIDVVPYYEGVNIDIVGNKYVGENSKTIKITSSLDGVSDTVYTFNVKYKSQEEKYSFDYPYTGNYQTFIAPSSNYYDIELWGGTGNKTAYGAYTKGQIYLEEGQILYVYVGRKAGTLAGTSSPDGNKTFFNSGTGDNGGWPGGGATDIRLVEGAWNNFDSLKSRIMVAGGGGTTNYGVAGAAGGLIGYNGGGTRGGTQTTYGARQVSSYANSSFGRANGGCAGGNGYYPGGGSSCVNGAGGGSSFISGHNGSNAIAESSTASKIVHTGQSIHYSNMFFTDTVMIDGKGYLWTNAIGEQELMPNPAGAFFPLGVGNNGDGYARIKTSEIVSNDNYLDSLIIKSGEDVIALNPTFEAWEQDLTVNLTKDQSKINISATPKDLLATVMGTGDLEIAPGDSDTEIVVTAQDGSTRTYSIHITREADNDPYPVDIKVNRMPAYLCKVNSEYCKYDFEKTTTEYNIDLPYAVREIELLVTPKSKWQTINYYTEYDFANPSNNIPVNDSEGVFTLTKEITTIYVEVISEDNAANAVYTYNFKRDVTGNNNLESITITNPNITIENFDPYVYEYYLTLPTGFSFDIEAIPERKENTKVEIQNNILTSAPYKTSVSGLIQGLNNVIITVTAENGDTKTYILHVYKGYESDVLLNSLTVTSGAETLELTPVFDNRINDYSIRVGSDITTININAIAHDINGTIVTGTGTKTLKSGVNNFQIEVKAKTINDSGEYDTNIYNLTIYKDMSNNSNISNITIDGYTLDPLYDKDIHEYYVNLNDGENSLNVNVVMESDVATYTIRGNNNLNKAVNEIVVTGIAEDKTYQVYKIYAYKSISTNNNLATLEYKITDDFISVPDFDKDTINYQINVGGEIRKIEFAATSEDKKAIVSGAGVYYLQTGTNTITISVTSESGSVKIYTVEVIRALDNDATLFEVTNNRGSEVIKQATSDYDYLINVQYEINNIEINGIPNSNLAVVSGNGTYNLMPGNNDITLRVTAEDKTYQDYVVRVVRDLSNNDDLSFLYVHEGGLIPDFNETTIYYEVKVPEEIDSLDKLHIEAITEDKNASFVINNPGGSLEIGVAREVTVVVTAPNKTDVKTYTISVTRQEATTDNLALENLETNRGELSPIFNPDTLNYEISVDNNIADIEIIGKAFNENVRVEGLGTKTLKVGKNLISVFVIGELGIQKDYQIVVTRKKSNDARLENIVIQGSVLSPSFDKDVDTYTINTSKEYLTFTTIKPIEEEATYKIEGNTSFKTGINEVKIIVTAPDGETTKEYIINAQKLGSANNNLASLEVEGYTLIPIFHKGVTFYAVDVPNNINSVMIKATPEDITATINGDGLQKIQTGENYFDVVVTSEANTKKTYTILITRDASDNNYLATLYATEGVFDKAFDKTINDYEIRVSNDVTEIELYGTVEDALANVIGFEKYKLNVGENNLEVTVTSESGKTNIYNIKVIREEVVSAFLTDLKVNNFSLDPEFNKEIFEYFITVPNEVTSLDLSYEKEDNNATVVVTGNENFIVGMNEVHINVTREVSETEILEQDYVIYVNRQMSTNNYLATLSLSEGALNPTFEKEENNYKVTVPNNITEITVYATTEDNASKITSGLGKHTLNPGLNTILVKVRSSIGVVRTYTIEVTREESTNNKLLDIVLKTIDGNVISSNPSFDSDVNNYDYILAERLEYVIINVVKGDNYQSIIGNGTKELTPGVNNFEVVVTAQNGDINTYTLTINNPLSSNNYATMITPSSGTLDPEFNKEINTYNLELEDVSSLSFEVTLESNKASVIGHEIKPVDEGTSVRIITVTAEDGTTKDYTINVTRPSKSEARLESLTIDNYPFEFNSNTFAYNIAVSKQKKKLLESEITAIAKDSEATINMMGDLNLTDGIVNIYTIEVIAKDGYTTQTYTLNVTRDSEEYTLRTNKYEIVRFEDETNEDYVIGIQPSTLVSDFKNNFENPAEDLKVYLETSEVEETDLTATAFVLKLEKNGYVYDTLRVIVRGDLTKDGKVNITDQVKMINYVGRTTTFDKYQMLAGDLTFDGKVNITDQVKIINYVGRTISDLNNKPTS